MTSLRYELGFRIISQSIGRNLKAVRPNLLKGACSLCIACLTLAGFLPAQTLTVLTNFSNSIQHPNGMVEGADGNFYGATSEPPTTAACSNDCGQIFMLTPAGTQSVLHTFNGTDGSSPNPLIQGSDGKFYGTTLGGGTGNCTLASGCGTVFSIVPGGSLVTLYNFCSQTQCADGYAPTAALVEGTDGNFYGTTTENAQSSGCTGACGTVFKITPSGQLTTLYTFDGTGGYSPNIPLVQLTGGDLYGTTAFGGHNDCNTGSATISCGTIFQITTSGTFTSVYSFCAQANCPDGWNPSALIVASNGNLYGTTLYGGSPVQYTFEPQGFGTVFESTPSGTLTTLFQFGETDGDEPNIILQASDGNFYGTTIKGGGGDSDNGTIFKMYPQGTLIPLFQFPSCCAGAGDLAPDGAEPNALINTGSGFFYGTTYYGGTPQCNCGVAFTFAVGTGGTTPSNIALSVSPSTFTVNQDAASMLTATVTSASGGGTPSGTVAFFNGTDEVGWGNISSGVATFLYFFESPTVTTYQITAVYSGDGTFATSTSPPQTLTVTALPTLPTPTFSPAGGTYTSSQNVAISDTTPAVIYYTNDGTTPTTSSAIYSSPIAVDTTQTLQAIAVNNDFVNSAVGSATYTITTAPDYQISVSPTSLTIAAGQAGTATFTVTPVNGFDSQVSFACGALPAEASCSFSPSSVTPNGNPVTTSLTVSTTAASAAMHTPRPFSLPPIYALFLPALGMGFLVSNRKKYSAGGLALIIVAVSIVLAAGSSCGGSSNMMSTTNTGTGTNTGTPPGTANVVVTATAGSMNQTANLTITITQ